MLDTGLVSWADFEWSLDATAHVSPDCLARALEIMERAWPETEEHMAKLAVNALIGLWAPQVPPHSLLRDSLQLPLQPC